MGAASRTWSVRQRMPGLWLELVLILVGWGGPWLLVWLLTQA